MNLYLNDLAPWERKKEYFQHIQLGKDVRTQTERLTNAIIDQTKSQISAASAIVASQENISESIKNVEKVISTGLDDVSFGLAELQSSFEWGISEIVWQIEQNRKVLKNILESLLAPLDTQAKERKKRADKAFSNGWFEDAEEEYLESEKLNKYDFTIHFSLGIIYLFHNVDKRKSLEYFDKAIKYARPESTYHESYALLYKSLIKRDLGLIDEAEKHTAEIINIFPELSIAYYYDAAYNALLMSPEKAIRSLEKAVECDIKYCLKADIDSDFDNIRDDLNRFLKSVLDDKISKFNPKLEYIDKKLLPKYYIFCDSNDSDNDYLKITALISNAKKCALTNSILDIDRAYEILSETEDIIQKDLKDLVTVKIGKVYEGTVAKVMDFGAFVGILNYYEGLLPSSQFQGRKLCEGDKVFVKVFEINDKNHIRFLLKNNLR